jgi:hypothetical protein
MMMYHSLDWFDSSSTREYFIDVLVFESYSLDIRYVHVLVRLTTIRRPSSLFSLRWWKSYGCGAAFLWECCFYNSIDWFDFISTRDCFINIVSLIRPSWFHIFERLIYEDVSYSLDIRYLMAWFCLLQSTVHLHSFRFAGGSLTAAVPFYYFPPSHLPHSIIPLKHFSLSYMWIFFLHIHSFLILTLFLWFTFLHYLMIKLILFLFFTIYITLVSLM